jgi:hypothetical protein
MMWVEAREPGGFFFSLYPLDFCSLLQGSGKTTFHNFFFCGRFAKFEHGSYCFFSREQSLEELLLQVTTKYSQNP